MDSEQYFQEPANKRVEQKISALNSVTPLSKYLAMTLFVVMPFIGGWIGYMYSPVKVVEIEKIVYQQIPPLAQNNFETDQQQTLAKNNHSTENFGWNEEACKNWSSPLASREERFACQKAIALAAGTGKKYRFTYYPEKITLTGTYVKHLYDADDESNFYVLSNVHFKADFDELNKLPHDRHDNPTVIFRNYETAEHAFGLSGKSYIPTNGRFCTLTGSTTIEISEIIIDHFDGGVPADRRLEAQLNKVIDVAGYTKDCRD